MEQLSFDLTKREEEHEIKMRISALHRELNYGEEGPHLRYSLRAHLQSRSVSECHDKGKLLQYESYLILKGEKK